MRFIYPSAGRRRQILLTTLLAAGAGFFSFSAQKEPATPAPPSPVAPKANGFLSPEPVPAEASRAVGGGDPEIWAARRAAAQGAESSGDLDQAEAQYAMAVREARGFPRGDPRTVESLTDWGRLLLTRGRFEQAQRVFEEIVGLEESEASPNPLGVAGALLRLGEAAASGHRADIALSALGRARAIYETRLGAYHPVVAETLGALARVHLLQKHYADAESLFRQALEIALAPRADVLLSDGNAPRSVRRPDYATAAAVLSGLGSVYDEQGRSEEAEQCYRQAMNALEPHVGSSAESLARLQSRLGNFYLRQQRFDLAETLLKKALSTRENVLGPEHLLVAESLDALAAVYRQTQRPDLGDDCVRRAETIRARLAVRLDELERAGPDEPEFNAGP